MYQVVFYYEEQFCIHFEDEKEAIAEYEASRCSSDVVIELWCDTWCCDPRSHHWEQMV